MTFWWHWVASRVESGTNTITANTLLSFYREVCFRRLLYISHYIIPSEEKLKTIEESYQKRLVVLHQTITKYSRLDRNFELTLYLLAWQARIEAGGTEFWKVFGLQIWRSMFHVVSILFLSTVVLPEPALKQSLLLNRARRTLHNDDPHLNDGSRRTSWTFELWTSVTQTYLNLSLNRAPPATVFGFKSNLYKAFNYFEGRFWQVIGRFIRVELYG